MPYVQGERTALLQVLFGGVSQSMAFGEFINFCTSAPPDDGSAPGAAESTVTNRLARNDTISFLQFDLSNGYALYDVQWQQSVSGSAVFTHWFQSHSSVEVTGLITWYDQLPYPVNVQSGDTIRFAPFRMKWRFSDVVSNYVALTVEDVLVLAFTGGSISSVNFGYFALSSTAPNRDGTNVTEPTGGGYGRVQFLDGSHVTITGGVTSTATNNITRTFPTATAPWSGLTHWAIYDNITGGNMLYYGALDSTVNVLTGESPSFLVGDWIVSCGP